MSKPIETPVDGKNAIIDFLIDSTKATLAALPEGVLDLLRAIAYEPSPVRASADAAELIYARQDELPPELLAIGAELATMTATHNFHGMGIDGRGLGIAKALKAKEGVKALLPEQAAPTKPPEAKPEFAGKPTTVVVPPEPV